MGQRLDAVKQVLSTNNIRRTILFLVILVSGLLLYLSEPWEAEWLSKKFAALRPIDREKLGREFPFTVPEWVALSTPLLALLMALGAHWGDARSNGRGRGIKDVINVTVGKHPYNLEADVISASMTKQSVLVAIAAALAAVIQLYQPREEVAFIKLVKILSTSGFAFAILFLLVSMVCYDYASRFRWPTFYKAQLVRKALWLDVLSWYFLLTSFILTIALINPRLSVLMSITAGFLMWWYYFFPPGGPGILGIRGILNHVVGVNDLDKAAAFYKHVLGLEIIKESTEEKSLQVGGWTQITLRKNSSLNPDVKEVNFAMPEEDVRFGVATLQENIKEFKKSHPEFASEPSEDKENVKVSLTDPSGNTIILSAPAKKAKG
ncbi:MAG: VOC family protein [Acidobacteriota bacterium]|nr:VOC family protein [Acidobacteriota bacterium]